MITKIVQFIPQIFLAVVTWVLVYLCADIYNEVSSAFAIQNTSPDNLYIALITDVIFVLLFFWLLGFCIKRNEHASWYLKIKLFSWKNFKSKLTAIIVALALFIIGFNNVFDDLDPLLSTLILATLTAGIEDRFEAFLDGKTLAIQTQIASLALIVIFSITSILAYRLSAFEVMQLPELLIDAGNFLTNQCGEWLFENV